MRTRLEGKSPAKETLLIELRSIISPSSILLDEVDRCGLNRVRWGMRGEGKTEGEAS